MSEIRMSLFDSVTEIPRDVWGNIADAPFGLRYSHLFANELSLNDQIRFWYAVFWKNNMPVGIAQFQLFRLDVRSFVTKQTPHLISRVEGRLKELLHRSLGLSKIWVLVCGDLYSTAPHGVWFRSTVPVQSQWLALMLALRVVKSWSDEQVQTDLIVIKDFDDSNIPPINLAAQASFHMVRTDPNMVLRLRPDWFGFDDYLGAINSKYRRRISHALELGKEVVARLLVETELARYSDKIDQLHHNVYMRSEIRTAQVPNAYFLRMSRYSMGRYRVRGYFLNHELIAFVSYFKSESGIQTQYLGMDYAISERLGLYQYILIDLVRHAIEESAPELEFGRTAQDIKAGVGALPKRTYCLVKHCSPIKNQLVDIVVQLIHPIEIPERHVFKSDRIDLTEENV